jgi:hypothetical protein
MSMTDAAGPEWVTQDLFFDGHTHQYQTLTCEVWPEDGRAGPLPERVELLRVRLPGGIAPEFFVHDAETARGVVHAVYHSLGRGYCQLEPGRLVGAIDVDAQLAYEAYADDAGWRSAITGEPLPLWHLAPEDVRAHWRAVIVQLTGRSPAALPR